jgi:hypothetical protein
MRLLLVIAVATLSISGFAKTDVKNTVSKKVETKKADAKKTTIKKDERKPNQEPNIHITPLQEGFPTEEAEKMGYKVDGPQTPEIIPGNERDVMLDKSGLTAYLGEMDQVDKDLFTMHCRRMNAKDVRARHPNVPTREIEKYQQLLKEWEKVNK